MEHLHIVSIVALAVLLFYLRPYLKVNHPKRILPFWVAIALLVEVVYSAGALIGRTTLWGEYLFMARYLHLANAALLFIALKSIISANYSYKRGLPLHIVAVVVPFIVLVISNTYPQYFSFTLDSYLNKKELYNSISYWLTLTISGVYLTLTLLAYIKGRKTEYYLKQIPSATKVWLATLLYGFTAVLLMAVAIELVQVFTVFRFDSTSQLFDFACSLLIVILTLVGYRTSLMSSPSNTTREGITPNADAFEIELDEKYLPIFTEIEMLMRERKLYLEPTLTLKDIADMLSINGAAISKAIKIYSNQSFPTYINSYRVEAVIEKMKSDKLDSFTILSLALESGFNSKASFNRIFKQQTGQTPSEFISNSRVEKE